MFWGGDLDRKAIDTASHHNTRPAQVFYKNLEIAADPLPSAFDPCDWVVSLETVEHLPDVLFTKFMERILRIARVGIVLSTPIIPVAHKAGNFRDSTPEQIHGWFPAGWQLVAEHILQEKIRGVPKDVYCLVVYIRG